MPVALERAGYADGLMAVPLPGLDLAISLTRETASGYLAGRVDAVLPGLLPDLSRHGGFAAGSPAFCVPYGYNEGKQVDSADCDALVSDLLAAYRLALNFKTS